MSIFSNYLVVLQFRRRLMGGIPKNPQLIEGWLRARAGIDQQDEVRRALLRTLLELGAEVSPDMSMEQLDEASKALAAERNTNGFKQEDSGGLYVESRIVKSMLKECIAVLYPKERWGKTLKGPQGYAAERIVPAEEEIYLGRTEPDGIELHVAHLSGPKGPYSAVNYVEYVDRPRLEFTLKVLNRWEADIPANVWPEIWEYAGEFGMGAMRSQGHGRFDCERFERISTADAAYRIPKEAKA